jgi:hypothetical protein
LSYRPDEFTSNRAGHATAVVPDPHVEHRRWVVFGAEHEADCPLLSDPTKEAATAIGKDGKILAIDKAVKPATSAPDMVAKLGELGIPSH